MSIKKNLMNLNPPSVWNLCNSGQFYYNSFPESAANTVFHLLDAPGRGKVIQIGGICNRYFWGRTYNSDVSQSTYWYFLVNGLRVFKGYNAYESVSSYSYGPIILPENKGLDFEVDSPAEMQIAFNYRIRDIDEVNATLVQTNGTAWVDLCGPVPGGKAYVPMCMSDIIGMQFYNDDTISHDFEIRLYNGDYRMVMGGDVLSWPSDDILEYQYYALPVVSVGWGLQFRLKEAHATKPCNLLFPYGIAEAV